MLNFNSYFNNSLLDNDARYNRSLVELRQVCAYIRIDFPKHHFDNIMHIIRSSPNTAYHYARYLVAERCIDLETVIMKDPSSIYYYALYTIRGRWIEAEPIIMKDPKWAVWYARDVINGRWLEAEPHIKETPSWCAYYEGNFRVKL